MNLVEKRFQRELGNNWQIRGFFVLSCLFILGSFFLTLHSVGRGANPDDCSGTGAFYCRQAMSGKWNLIGADFFTAFLVTVSTAIFLILLWKLIYWIANGSNSSKK